MINSNKKKFAGFLLLMILLTYLKIDYRFIETFTCCQDDHDYLIHAETIAIDFDLDYSNQLEGFETRRFNDNGVVAPKGFIGSGFLASPFLFLGNILQNLVENNGNLDSKILNYKILLYSLSAICYFFIGINLLTRVAYDLKVKVHPYSTILLISATGLIYYSFERYSMTHVYEFFTTSLVIYFSHKYLTTNQNLYAVLTPMAIFLSLSVRWVNYFVIFLPFILYNLFQKEYKYNSMLKNKNFMVSFFSSFILFLYSNYEIYGKITINPQYVYETENMASGFLNGSSSIFQFVFDNLSNLLIIFTTKEFGIILFSPLIFFASVYCFFIFLDRKLSLSLKIMLFASFVLIYAPVLLWKSTASSYGFRYLLSSVSLCFLLYLHFIKHNDFRLIIFLLHSISVFSFLSILFFETSPETSLSLVEVTNSFGRKLRFSQPEYLSGYIDTVFNIQSYLKIFSTSFLGVIIFKGILSFLNIDQFNSLLSQYGLPTNNEDFQSLLINLETISFYKISLVILLLILITMKTQKSIKKYVQI